MADVAADLVDELTHSAAVVAAVADRVYAGRVPAGTVRPLIWLQRRSVEYGGCMGDEEEPLKERFDIEIVADDPGEAVEVADMVRACLHDRYGLIGDHYYSSVTIADAAENYVPRNLSADEFLFISSLDCEVIRP